MRAGSDDTRRSSKARWSKETPSRQCRDLPRPLSRAWPPSRPDHSEICQGLFRLFSAGSSPRAESSGGDGRRLVAAVAVTLVGGPVISSWRWRSRSPYSLPAIERSLSSRQPPGTLNASAQVLRQSENPAPWRAHTCSRPSRSNHGDAVVAGTPDGLRSGDRRRAPVSVTARRLLLQARCAWERALPAYPASCGPPSPTPPEAGING
jgi:hypothetical protein